MKTRPAIAALALIAAALPAREFTDLQGRKLEAELTAVSNGQATMKRSSDGRLFTVPVASWSAEDQKLMNEFAANNMTYNFEVRYAKKKMGETKANVSGATEEVEKWAYKITLRNLSSGTASGLTAQYWLFRKDYTATSRAPARVQVSGSANVPELVRSASTEFVTSPVELSKIKLKAGYVFTAGNTGASARGDQMGGFALKIFKDGKEVYKFATDPDFLAATVAPAKP